MEGRDAKSGRKGIKGEGKVKHGSEGKKRTGNHLCKWGGESKIEAEKVYSVPPSPMMPATKAQLIGPDFGDL